MDDDEENLPLSRDLRSAQVLSYYVMPKIPKNDRRGNLEKHLNAYKTYMNLRGATPIMKCRAFHLILSRVVEIRYNRLPPGSIRVGQNSKPTSRKCLL